METAFILDNKDPIIQNFDLDFIHPGSKLDHEGKEYFVMSIEVVCGGGDLKRTVKAINTGRIKIPGLLKIGGN